MRRLALGVMGIAVVAWGCGGNPTAPTQGASPPIVVPSATAYTVSGVVRAGNVPVAGARVVVLDQVSPGSAVTTDSDGRYSIQAPRAQPWGMAPLLSASKPGYFADIRFTDVNYAAISKDTQLDFALDPLVRISLGDVISGQSFAAACSHWDYGTSVCHRFALTMPAAGALEVTASAAPVIHFSIEIVGPDGTFAAYVAYPPASPVRVKVPVEAGLTYEVRVTDPGKRAFELTTALH